MHLVLYKQPKGDPDSYSEIVLFAEPAVPHKTRIRTPYDAVRASSMATAQPRKLRHRIAAKTPNSRPNLSKLTTTSNSCPIEGLHTQLPSESYSISTDCRPFILCLIHLACAALGSTGKLSRDFQGSLQHIPFEARDKVYLDKHLYLA